MAVSCSGRNAVTFNCQVTFHVIHSVSPLSGHVFALSQHVVAFWLYAVALLDGQSQTAMAPRDNDVVDGAGGRDPPEHELRVIMNGKNYSFSTDSAR